MPYQPWANPDPQSIAGLNSAMVYGENIQVTAGLNHQIAIGSNLQLCLNPGVAASELGVSGSAEIAGILGSGLGGNLQLTVGSNTAITWGRQFQINMGPEQITIDGNRHKAFSKAMCAAISAACLSYAIAYGKISDEDGRAKAVLVFQGTIDTLLAAFMKQLMVFKGAEQGLSDELRELFKAPKVDHSTTLEEFVSDVAAAQAGIFAMLFPVVALANEEGHFQGETQASSK